MFDTTAACIQFGFLTVWMPFAQFVGGNCLYKFRKRQEWFVSLLASHPPPGSVDIRKYMRRGVCMCLLGEGREVVLVNGYLKWEQI